MSGRFNSAGEVRISGAASLIASHHPAPAFPPCILLLNQVSDIPPLNSRHFCSRVPHVKRGRQAYQGQIAHYARIQPGDRLPASTLFLVRSVLEERPELSDSVPRFDFSQIDWQANPTREFTNTEFASLWDLMPSLRPRGPRFRTSWQSKLEHNRAGGLQSHRRKVANS